MNGERRARFRVVARHLLAKGEPPTPEGIGVIAHLAAEEFFSTHTRKASQRDAQAFVAGDAMVQDLLHRWPSVRGAFWQEFNQQLRASPTQRVASQFLRTGKNFKLDIGMPILYGKYKNKKGVIKGFKVGPKGDPIVVVEQVPNDSGRKQDKELKLFKIRYDKERAEQMKQGVDGQAQRLAAKYQNKKKVKTEDGDETTVYEYSEGQVQHRNREKAKKVEKLRGKLDELRRKITGDLDNKDPDIRLAALAVALIDETYERVGNEDSAKEGHFGVTGWKVKHITFSQGKATLSYVGKSGVKQKKTVTNAKALKVLKEAVKGKSPDEEILCEGDDCRITAQRVNEYLKPFDITAKDLRGLHANEEMRSALKAQRKGKLPDDKKEREEKLKAEFKAALEETAKAVGHEASTLKSQYLVPGLEDAYTKDGTIPDKLDKTGIDQRGMGGPMRSPYLPPGVFCRTATKTHAEKEDEEAERLIRPSPKKKPPRNDLRRERINTDEDDDPDAEQHKKDQSKNYKDIGASLVSRVAYLYLLAKANEPEHKPGEHWQTESGWTGRNPDGVDHTFKTEDESKAFAKGESVEGEGAEGAADEEEYNADEVKARAGKLKDYTSLRDYTDEELSNESDEYFENDYTVALAPDAFKSPEDLQKLIKDAKPQVLTDDDYAKLGERGDTDSIGILMSDDPKEEFRSIAKEYGRDAGRVEKGFTDGDAMPPPIVIKDSKGQLYLMAGNTRMMGAAAMGIRMPVKVIDIKGEFDTKAAAKMMEEDEAEASDEKGKPKIDMPAPSEKQQKAEKQEQEQEIAKAQEAAAETEKLKKTLDAVEDVVRDLGGVAGKKFDKFDDKQQAAMADAYDDKLDELVMSPPTSKKDIEAIAKLSEATPGPGIINDPEKLGDFLAKQQYAKKVLANPLLVGGQAVTENNTAAEGAKVTKEQLDESRKRGEQAYHQFNALSSEQRDDAYYTLHAAYLEAEPGSPKHTELRGLMNGVAFSMAMNGDPLPYIAHVPESFGVLGRKLKERGDGSEMKLLSTVTNLTDEESRATVEGLLEGLEDDELFEAAGGDSGPLSDWVRIVDGTSLDPDYENPSQKQKQHARQMLRTSLLDTMTFIDPLIGEVLKASGKDVTPENVAEYRAVVPLNEASGLFSAEDEGTAAKAIDKIRVERLKQQQKKLEEAHGGSEPTDRGKGLWTILKEMISGNDPKMLDKGVRDEAGVLGVSHN